MNLFGMVSKPPFVVVRLKSGTARGCFDTQDLGTELFGDPPSSVRVLVLNERTDAYEVHPIPGDQFEGSVEALEAVRQKLKRPPLIDPTVPV